jgi:anti-sigma B factor antagonist
MQIEQRSVGGVIVVDVTGKITLGESTEILKDKVNSLVNQGHTDLVLNLAGVSYMDSAGLGVMMAAYATAKRQGGNVKLLSLTKRITDLLSITKLSTIFETFDSETEAVASFTTGAAVL